jgi:hypothetical protein
MTIECDKIIGYLDEEIDKAFQNVDEGSSKSDYDKGSLDAYKKIKVYIEKYIVSKTEEAEKRKKVINEMVGAIQTHFGDIFDAHIVDPLNKEN